MIKIKEDRDKEKYPIVKVLEVEGGDIVYFVEKNKNKDKYVPKMIDYGRIEGNRVSILGGDGRRKYYNKDKAVDIVELIYDIHKESWRKKDKLI